MTFTLELFEDKGAIVVQCQEYDIATRGENEAEALASFARIIRGYHELSLLDDTPFLDGVPAYKG